KVLPDALDAKADDFVGFFLEPQVITELAACGMVCFRVGHAVRLEFTLRLLAVKGHFFVEIAVIAVAADQDAQFPEEERNSLHEFRLFSRNTALVRVWFPQSTI